MTIIIGLGNPGEKFKNTKHNIGFLILDAFAKNNNFEDFKLSKKYNAEISEGLINEEKVILVKPQTFMNESGKSVQKIIRNSKFEIRNSTVVVHDDIDLPIGKIKVVKDRGSAGHKGVESIIKAIGNNNLVRFRVGIESQKNETAKEVVLENFSKTEKEIINSVILKTREALNFYLLNDLEKTMNEYNK